MNYVVYVNHPNNKAVVHSTSCGKYINRRRDKTVNGFWSETFETLEEALDYERKTGKRELTLMLFVLSSP